MVYLSLSIVDTSTNKLSRLETDSGDVYHTQVLQTSSLLLTCCCLFLLRIVLLPLLYCQPTKVQGPEVSYTPVPVS